MTGERIGKKYVNVSTDALFTEGAWEIHGNYLRHRIMNPAVSRVIHYCAEPRKEYSLGTEYCHVWANLNGSRVCPACGETMPDSVQTLWTLQNFDIDFTSFNTPPALSPLKVTG